MIMLSRRRNSLSANSGVLVMRAPSSTARTIANRENAIRGPMSMTMFGRRTRCVHRGRSAISDAVRRSPHSNDIFAAKTANLPTD
jgi:hypothetical protein